MAIANPAAATQQLVGGQTRGQPEQRRYTRFRDQHERTWGGVIEIRSGDLVSPAEPLFQAPIIPPAEFVRVLPGEFNRVEIDYVAWRGDVARADADWQAMLKQAAMQIGTQGHVESLIENPSPEILFITGPRPKDRHGYVDDLVIQACMAGNRWVLFGEGEIPEKAKPFFAKPQRSVQALRLAPAVTEDPFAEDRPVAPAAPSGGQGGPDKSEEPKVAAISTEEYDLEMVSPGRWRMPDGDTLQGTRAEAEHALEQLFPEHYLALVSAGVE